MNQQFKIVITALAAMILCGCTSVDGTKSAVNNAVNWLWLDELDVAQTNCGWQTAQKNKTVERNPLTIGGQKYERGVGTHADARIDIKLSGKGQRFEALVGLDDEILSSGKGSVQFGVIADGKPVWQSQMLKPGQKAVGVNVDIQGVKKLTLQVNNGGDGIDYDHADWVMARISYKGVKPGLVTAVAVKPYILTPKEELPPRITGAKVFGVRPGSPVLFTLTATGEKPMQFAVENLPQGLALNPKNGQIRGILKEKGEYKTIITAQNKRGKAQREFKIVVGDTICLTPPMGWNSWNSWACAVDDAKVRASAKAMVDSGLVDHGWTYINIDDCWMRKEGSNDPVIGGPVRDKDGYLLTNAKFPDMKALTDYIHSLGLKVGIYISPGPNTCAGFIGSWQYEQKDAQRFAEWGFDYLKYDWCGYGKIAPNPSLEEMKKPYAVMRKELDRVDRDIVYSLCQYGMGDVWKWGAEVGGNCWRTTGDINDSWGSMAGIGFKQADLYSYASPGHWNDPDMLVVGNVGWGPNLHPSRLTVDEQYTHISLWCLLASPLLIGCPLEQLDDFTRGLLTNDEVLEVNQDSLGQQAHRVAQAGDTEVWAKKLQDGSYAVGLFNHNAWNKQKITANWDALGLKGRLQVRDLWRQKDLSKSKSSFTADVPAHGVALIRVFPE
jgi:alpha-galactosidase